MAGGIREGWRTWLILPGSVVAVFAVLAWVEWSVSHPGERRYLVSVLVGAVAVIGMVSVWRRTTALTAPLAWTAVAVGLLAVVAVVGAPSWVVAQRVRRAEPQLTATMTRLIERTTPACYRPAGADAEIEPVGHVDEICVVVSDRMGYVTVESGTPAHGLLYNTRDGRPPVMDKCLNHLFGPWWEISEFDSASCPQGFDAVGGG